MTVVQVANWHHYGCRTGSRHLMHLHSRLITTCMCCSVHIAVEEVLTCTDASQHLMSINLLSAVRAAVSCTPLMHFHVLSAQLGNPSSCAKDLCTSCVCWCSPSCWSCNLASHKHIEMNHRTMTDSISAAEATAIKHQAEQHRQPSAGVKPAAKQHEPDRSQQQKGMSLSNVSSKKQKPAIWHPAANTKKITPGSNTRQPLLLQEVKSLDHTLNYCYGQCGSHLPSSDL